MRFFSLVILVGAIACADAPSRDTPPLPAVTLPAEFTEVLRAYEQAYARRDSAAISALFAADGYLMRPGQPPIRGNAAIGAALAPEGGALRLVPVAFGQADSAGYIIGTFGAEQSANRGGKFVLALTRRAPNGGGTWRIAADIDNSNAR